MIVSKLLRNLVPAAVLAALISSCAAGETSSDIPSEALQEQTEAAGEMSGEENFRNENEMHVSLKNGGNEFFEASDGWSNGSMFNVTWRGDNCVFDNGTMRLVIDRDKAAGDGIPYSGGEYRSKDFYGCGRYEVRMKAIKNDGVVSSFFTYTGPSDNNQWDEIDIEILGKDTTKVQFNYFTDGVGEHEYLYDLGFDSAEDFHDYAFEWHKDRIVWFVDGKEVYTADENIPVTPGKIMMNAWCGIGVDGWLNAFDDSSLPLSAEYESVSFTAFDE